MAILNSASAQKMSQDMASSLFSGKEFIISHYDQLVRAECPEQKYHSSSIELVFEKQLNLSPLNDYYLRIHDAKSLELIVSIRVSDMINRTIKGGDTVGFNCSVTTDFDLPAPYSEALEFEADSFIENYIDIINDSKL